MRGYIFTPWQKDTFYRVEQERNKYIRIYLNKIDENNIFTFLNKIDENNIFIFLNKIDENNIFIFLNKREINIFTFT